MATFDKKWMTLSDNILKHNRGGMDKKLSGDGVIEKSYIDN